LKEIIDLVVSPQQAASNDELRKLVLRHTSDKKHFTGFRIIRRSIDARSRNIKINLKAEVYFGEEMPEEPHAPFHFFNVTERKPVVIIGAGPAGLFAALRLLELGLKPIIIERGKNVKDRRRDLAAINKEHIINPDSNYCFGEGGAGTYSDGKLYTRSTKRGDTQKILSLLVQHGASEEILIDAHPHIGTNKLPKIIVNIRENILKHGGEIYFQTRLTDLLIEENEIKGVQVESLMDNTITEIKTDSVILATGHSARDIFELLNRRNILIEAKPFAMGVRVEHPQELIDSIQYHCFTKQEVDEKRIFLPASAYSLVQQVNGRGVYSFCMCPGGIIAPCATAPGEIVVNGWSPSKRNNPFANSGIVVSVELEDLKAYKQHGPLAGLRYQQELERIAFRAAGQTQAAPAQRLEDFTKSITSSTLPKTSYQPGIHSAPLHELLPPNIGKRLQEGFKAFGRKMKGYLANEAVIHGVESRTSSPVRIPRSRESYEHVQVKGLYPVGEGAGYAGGIISAAIDGQQSATAIAIRNGITVR